MPRDCTINARSTFRRDAARRFSPSPNETRQARSLTTKKETGGLDPVSGAPSALRLHRGPARAGWRFRRAWFSRPHVGLAPAKCSKGARRQTPSQEQLGGQRRSLDSGFDWSPKVKKINELRCALVREWRLFRGCEPKRVQSAAQLCRGEYLST